MAEVKFRKPYSKPERFISEPGKRTIGLYELSLNNHNQKQLLKVGEKDIYAEIQEYADEVSIEQILARVAVGDMSDFRPDGIYQDATKVPTNFIEAQKEIMKVHTLWNRLPMSVKEKYENDVNVFMSKAGEKAWLVDAGLIDEPTRDVVLETDIKDAVKGVTDAAPEAET